jgi:excisionase family DNA binding protein
MGYYTVSQVATILGVCNRTILSRISSGEIPALRIVTTNPRCRPFYKIRKEDFEAYLERIAVKGTVYASSSK